MGFTALDYSSAISGADLVAASVDTVFRYITDPSWPKSLQSAEYVDLIHHRIRVYLLDEGTADYMVNGSYAGFAGGATRARERRARANQIGATGPIFYSLDIGATPEQIDIALEFLAGAHSVDPGGVGAYGEYAFVVKAADSGYPIFGTEGWSGGQRDPRAVAWQMARQITVAGVLCDVVDLNPTPAPPAPSHSTQEEDMPALAIGSVPKGAGENIVVPVPPPNFGSAGWGNVWLSLASANGDAHVRVDGYVHGSGWEEVVAELVVLDHGDRANPCGGAMTKPYQKFLITRLEGSDTVPIGYLVEATAR